MTHTKQEVDIVITAKAVVTNTEREEIFFNHSLAVKDGVIIALCPESETQHRFQWKEHIELLNHILLPGLVNAHGHAAMTLLRGIANDLPLMDWLNNHIWPAEAKWADASFVKEGTELAIGEMLRSGTTCFSDMYFFPDEVASVAESTGIRAQIVCPILDFPSVWAQNADEYIAKAEQLADEYTQSDLINVGLGPHAPYTVSDEPLQKIKSLALQKDLPVQIHCHETKFEVESAYNETKQRPLLRLKNLGLFDEGFSLQCVHMTEVNDEEIKWLSNTSASIIHCPESNLKLASGFAPVAKYLEANINVALGTDGAASNNDLDMFGEMRTAALIAKAYANDASAMSAWQTLDIATRGGAKALGIWDQVGSLELGKQADICAINIESLNSMPSYDPVGDLVYSVNSRQVSDVWVKGQHLLKQGKLTTLSESKLLNNAKRWRDQIAKPETNS